MSPCGRLSLFLEGSPTQNDPVHSLIFCLFIIQVGQYIDYVVQSVDFFSPRRASEATKVEKVGVSIKKWQEPNN